MAKKLFSLSILWVFGWDIPPLFPRCSESTKPKHEDNKHNSSTRYCVYWWENGPQITIFLDSYTCAIWGTEDDQILAVVVSQADKVYSRYPNLQNVVSK